VALLVLETLGQSEIEHFDRSGLRDLDVRGLQIAVDDVLPVRRLERFRDLEGDANGVRQRKRTVDQALGNGRSLHELEHEGRQAIEIFEAVDSRDVRMIQRGEDLRFPGKTHEPIRIVRESRREYLDRDVAIQLHIARAIDLAHATHAEQRVNGVRADHTTDERLGLE
jgi:hypothetical protein